MGWLVPKSCKRLTLDDVEQALTQSYGNVSVAAARLHVDAADLRHYVNTMPMLMEAALEGAERIIDAAESEIVAAMREGSRAQRAMAAKWLLEHSPAAKRRGWTYNTNTKEANTVGLRWLDDEPISTGQSNSQDEGGD